MKDTWVRLIDQALLVGGVGEACSVLRRVGPRFFPGDGGSLPLDTICLHLEKASQVDFLYIIYRLANSCLWGKFLNEGDEPS